MRYVILLSICCLLTLCGCSLDQNQSSASEEFSSVDSSDIYLFTDPDTGVQYWVYCHKGGYSGMGGICPRLDRFGNVVSVALNLEMGGD